MPGERWLREVGAEVSSGGRFGGAAISELGWMGTARGAGSRMEVSDRRRERAVIACIASMGDAQGRKQFCSDSSGFLVMDQR